MKPMSLTSPEAIASEYKGNKKAIANAARMGLIDAAAALMAGMHIDRMRSAAAEEQKTDTTVAQDIFGGPMQQQGLPQAPMRPQPQQPRPQMAQSQGIPGAQMAAAQPQMAPGVEGLPTGNVGNYAEGGIVAFGDGGDVPGYAGKEESLVRTKYGRDFDFLPIYVPSKTEPPPAPPLASDASEVFSNIGTSVYNLGRSAIDPISDFFAQPTSRGSVLRVDPNTGKPVSLGEYLRLQEAERNAAALPEANRIAANAPPGTRVTNPNYVEPVDTELPPAPKGKRGTRDGQGSAPPPPAAPNLKKSTILDAPTLPTYTPVTAPTIPSAPTLPAFNPNEVKIKGAELKMPTIQDIKDITKEREQAEAAAGVNKNLTAEQLARVEEKQAKLDRRKGEAGGEALMHFGLGLFGARKGEEAQKASESGRAALASYKGDMKELRDARDKLDERAEALRVADNQAKKTNSAADLAKLDAQKNKYDAAQLKVYEVESSLAEKSAMVSANVYNTRSQQEMEGYKTGVTAGQQQFATQQQAASKHFGDMVQAATQLHNIKQQAVTAERGHQIEMYRAQLAHSASMYNSSVIKQAGLDERRSRTLIEASDSFIRSNKDSMYYADKPQLLQQDALNYARTVEQEFMNRNPGGTAPPRPTTNRPSLDQFQR